MKTAAKPRPERRFLRLSLLSGYFKLLWQINLSFRKELRVG